MKLTVLMGSPRLAGNTAELCLPFIDELERAGAEVRYTPLAEKNVAPCRGCYACQRIAGEYGCAQRDDMYGVAEDVAWCDCLMLATPTYTWYCPTAMKSTLDRCFGLNKFYRPEATGSLRAGKSVALLVTHGYEREYAARPFELGVERLCEHSRLRYLGMYSVRDVDDLASFRTPEATNGAREFARSLLQNERFDG